MSGECLFSLFIIFSTISACSRLVVDWIQSQGNNPSPVQNILRMLARAIYIIFPVVGIYIAAFLISEAVFIALLIVTFMVAPIVALFRPTVRFMELLRNLGRKINLNHILEAFQVIYPTTSGIMFMVSVVYNWIYFDMLCIHLRVSPLSYIFTFLGWLPYIVLYATATMAITVIGALIIKKTPHMKIGMAIGGLSPWLIMAHHCFSNYQTFYSHLNHNYMTQPISVTIILTVTYIALSSTHIENLRKKARVVNSSLSWFKFLCLGQSIFLIGFISWLLLIVPRYAEISTDCTKQIQQSFTLTDGQKVKGVLARRFETHFLIRNCVSNEMEFVKTDWNL